MEVQKDFKELLALFNAHDVKYMIVGGYVLAYHGAPRYREVTKNIPPILLAFWPVFFVATRGEYSNMHLLPRLEYEPKFGAQLWVDYFL